MKLLLRIIFFSIIFTTLFFAIRTTGVLSTKLLVENVGGLPWLYSTIGLIFGITSAFIIQSEWNNWDSLVNAVKEEVSAMQRLLLFNKHLPGNISRKISSSIKSYLRAVIAHWHEDGRSTEVETALQNLQDEMYTFLDKHDTHSEIGYALVSKILSYRDDRIHYSSRAFPLLLKTLVVFSTFLLIAGSLFIGVKSMILDYILTLSIAVLGYLILEVINDLSNPLKPGSWHITSDSYERLLKEIE